MIEVLIDVLHKLQIYVMIAPYEADAQIAYLVKEGIADIGISEDSDLLVYGCTNLVVKLKQSGDCQYIELSKVWGKDSQTDASLKILKTLKQENLIELCIMSGCDYIPSLKQIGLKTGLKYFSKAKDFTDVIKLI